MSLEGSCSTHTRYKAKLKGPGPLGLEQRIPHPMTLPLSLISAVLNQLCLSASSLPAAGVTSRGEEDSCLFTSFSANRILSLC